MKKIVFDSVKLPDKFNQFIPAITKQPNIENKIDAITLLVDCHLPMPVRKIPVGGYVKSLCETKPELLCNNTRYRMIRELYRARSGKMHIVLSKVLKELKEMATANNLSEPVVRVNGVRFIIHNKKYTFIYHAPAKAVVLKRINNKDIGRLNQVQIEALICPEGDLSFCAPSHCTKVWREVWICK